MINTKNKVITVAILFAIVILSASFGLFREDKGVVSPNIETVGEMERTTLGGVSSRMPDNSTKILFESLLGVKLQNYHSYQDVFETLSALRSNEIQAAWFPDVTVNYLLQMEKGLKEVPTPDSEQPRLEFAMAVKPDRTQLLDELNSALASLKKDGKLQELQEYYVTNASAAAKYTPSDMEEIIDSNQTLYVGVTGAVWPIDLVDIELEPYGFSVALMNEIGKLLHKDVQFVTLRNDTAFSSLMGGKVDLLFCYGTSKSTLTDQKNYIMTDGYYSMYKYSYLVLE